MNTSKITAEFYVTRDPVLVYGQLAALREGTGLPRHLTNQMDTYELVVAMMERGAWATNPIESNGYVVRTVTLGKSTLLVATNGEEIRFALIQG